MRAPTPVPSKSLRMLTVGAIGIVFGDIGTSPLYTIQECFGAHGVAPTPSNVLGVVSLIVWSVTLVVTVKYLGCLMRADNRGEGGILALLALLPESRTSDGRTVTRGPTLLALAALLGAALLFGDGIITPAISVLSALEGLEIATPASAPLVVPLTIVILIGLFLIQRRGTASIGRWFGPIMIVWFTTIFVLGVVAIVKQPAVLHALSPVWGVRFFLANGWMGFVLLGAVVLAVTGGEALYADMGHFGLRPIRIAWLALIFPALICCYLGQAAVLLDNPAASVRPFFFLVPHGSGIYLLVAIATPATVIASQALISGVFSLARQAVQLGYFPRLRIQHMASDTEGQIYVPFMNWVLAIACIALVAGFRESSKLAAAFGLAVSATMAITSILFYAVMRRVWQRGRLVSMLVLVFFLSFDLPFLAANLLKFSDGGYLPLLIATAFLTLMLIWRRGRLALREYYARESQSIGDFMAGLARGEGAQRAPGTAIVMASQAEGVPPVLLHFARRVGVIPETVVLLTIVTLDRPYADNDAPLVLEELGQGFYRLVAEVGFMETPHVPRYLARAKALAPWLELDEASYFLGHETFIPRGRYWPERLFETLFGAINRNARTASRYFHIPPDNVIEIGAQIDL